jgi:uncharacterized protein YpbB
MVTYDWNCRTVDAYPSVGELTDVVYNVHWRVTGLSEELDSQGNPYQANNIGIQTLNTEDITDFIPVDELTNEQVTEWVKSTMDEEEVSRIEENIKNQIDNLITPKSITLTLEN